VNCDLWHSRGVIFAHWTLLTLIVYSWDGIYQHLGPVSSDGPN